MSRSLKELLAEIDILKKEADSVRPLKPEQEQRIFQKFRLDWNFHSNAIEGNKLSQGETRVFLLEGLTAQGKPLKDHLDIRGHDEVISFLLDYVRRKAELSEADIRNIHKILLVEPYKAQAVTPDGKRTEKWIKLGEYKSEPNQVTTATGKVRVFTLPAETPAKMGELMAWFRKQIAREQVHPVVTAALFHHQFVAIHPFDDGNGRMARILMNLVLLQHGFPPVIIHTTERDKYFFALGKADAGETTDFVTLIAERLIASLQLYMRGAKGEAIEEADDIDKKIALLKQELQHIPEPIIFNEEVFRKLAVGPVQTLLLKLVTKLKTFDDMFARASSQVSTGSFAEGFTKTEEGVVKAVQFLLAHPNSDRIHIGFSWQSFKKTPLNAFGCGVQIDFHFEELKLRVKWANKPELSRVYAEGLKEEDCIIIARDVAELVYNTVSANAKKKTA